MRYHDRWFCCWVGCAKLTSQSNFKYLTNTNLSLTIVQFTIATGFTVAFKVIVNQIRLQTTNYVCAAPSNEDSWTEISGGGFFRLKTMSYVPLSDCKVLDCFANPSSKKWKTSKLSTWVLFQHEIDVRSWKFYHMYEPPQTPLRDKISLLYHLSFVNRHHKNTTSSRARRIRKSPHKYVHW